MLYNKYMDSIWSDLLLQNDVIYQTMSLAKNVIIKHMAFAIFIARLTTSTHRYPDIYKISSQ